MVMFQFIVLQILVFSGVIYFLKKIVYGDTESAIKRLGHVYQDLLNKQNELTQKIEQAEKEYQAKKEEGSAIIDKMKYDAMDDMRKKEDEIVKKARAEAEDIINKAHAAKDQFYREIEKELSRKMIDFISGLMGDVFTEKLAQPVHDVLVNDYLARAKDFDLSNVDAALTEIGVRSALPLQKEVMEQLNTLLTTKLKRQITLVEKADKTLVAGIALEFGTLLLDGSLSNSVREAAENHKKKIASTL